MLLYFVVCLTLLWKSDFLESVALLFIRPCLLLSSDFLHLSNMYIHVYTNTCIMYTCMWCVCCRYTFGENVGGSVRLMAILEARGRRESLKFADITAQLVSSVLRALILCVVACGCMKPLEVAGLPCQRRAQFVFEYFSLCMASMQCAQFV